MKTFKTRLPRMFSERKRDKTHYDRRGYLRPQYLTPAQRVEKATQAVVLLAAAVAVLAIAFPVALVRRARAV